MAAEVNRTRFIFTSRLKLLRIVVFPAGPNQLVLPPAPAGGSSQASVRSRAAAVRSMGCSWDPFYNNFNGEQYAWIKGTFDRTTTPATLTFTASPPASLAPVSFTGDGRDRRRARSN